MPASSRRPFRVESPPAAKVATVVIVIVMAMLCSRVSDGLFHDATVSSIVTFATMLAVAAAFLWPRRLILGRDGVAVEGFFGGYRAWNEITAVRLERGYRGKVTIELACTDGSTSSIEPHFKIDAAALVEEIEARRRAFAEGEFESVTPKETPDYRVVAAEPHVRVLEDPRNPLEQRLDAVRVLASVDRAQAERVLDEVLEDTADPRAREILLRG